METVDWNDYAHTYDLMAGWNPAYQDLLARFENAAKHWQLSSGTQILEVGAGTGNFSCLAAALHPEAQIILSEPGPEMRNRAQEKVRHQGLTNVQVLSKGAEDLEFADNSLGGAILVHVLYALGKPDRFLRRLYDWLQPGAPIFACDFGRLMDVGDWRRYLILEMIKKKGLQRTLIALWRGRGIARANRVVAQAQRDGQYWMHSPKEFTDALREAGFHVLHSEVAYRGYSDLVLCRKM